MANGTKTRALVATDNRFPRRLRDALAQERPLLDALTALRSLGDEGDGAVEAISSLRRISTIKLSWALWESLTEGTGVDSEALLLGEIPVALLDRARAALFGSWRDDCDSTCVGRSNDG